MVDSYRARIIAIFVIRVDTLLFKLVRVYWSWVIFDDAIETRAAETFFWWSGKEYYGN